MSGEMTVREMGHRGGTATLAKYGRRHFSRIAARARRLTHEQYVALGHLGAAASLAVQDSAARAAAGKVGGEKTLLLFGRDHYREAGRKGGRATAAKRRAAG